MLVRQDDTSGCGAVRKKKEEREEETKARKSDTYRWGFGWATGLLTDLFVGGVGNNKTNAMIEEGDERGKEGDGVVWLWVAMWCVVGWRGKVR
jgi:hypothetical protein